MAVKYVLNKTVCGYLLNYDSHYGSYGPYQSYLIKIMFFKVVSSLLQGYI